MYRSINRFNRIIGKGRAKKAICDMIIYIATLFLYSFSALLDQSLREDTAVDDTAISTPLDNVPLYTMLPPMLLIMLLKSSHAVSSSDRFSFATPATHDISFYHHHMY